MIRQAVVSKEIWLCLCVKMWWK